MNKFFNAKVELIEVVLDIINQLSTPSNLSSARYNQSISDY